MKYYTLFYLIFGIFTFENITRLKKVATVKGNNVKIGKLKIRVFLFYTPCIAELCVANIKSGRINASFTVYPITYGVTSF